jgi:hypothetical protein
MRTLSMASARALTCGLAAVVSVGLARAQDAGPEAARWVSSDAVLYIELPHPAALLDRLTDERLQGPLRFVPPIRAALDRDDLKKVGEVASIIAKKMGTTRAEALECVAGGGAVFVVEAIPDAPPGAYLIVTPKDPAMLKKASAALIELARKDAEDKGQPDPVASIEYRGHTGYRLGNAIYGIVNDRLIVADRPQSAKVVADRMLDGLGDAKPVSDRPEFAPRKLGLKKDAVAWAFARLDRIREINPDIARASSEKRKTPETILFGGWFDAVRKAPNASASIQWSADRLALGLDLAAPKDGRESALKGYIPPKGSGAPAPLAMPKGVASLSLWRDLATVWEARADLLPPEEVQNLAKLDGVAGQFFGGRDFGTGVLGALQNDFRLVVSLQDYDGMKPRPDLVLPSFGLILDVKPDDDDFDERLKVAFQTFIGLANVGAAQSKAPPLELGSETFEGVTIATARFIPPKKPAAGEAKDDAKGKPEPVHYRMNYSPSAVQVGNYFAICSSAGLARDLVKALKAPAGSSDSTLAAQADGAALAKLVDLNRERLVMQNMLEKGHDKEQAEAEIGLLASLLRYLGQGKLSIADAPEATRFGIEFRLGR